MYVLGDYLPFIERYFAVGFALTFLIRSDFPFWIRTE
jgi:hypothetical protein